MATALPLRSYTPLRMVLTICGHCFSEDPDRGIDYGTDILQGNLVLRDGSVWLRRYCRRGHGEVWSLYDEDYELWEFLQQWRVPTREIIPDTPNNVMPIPMGYGSGLGELQTQHSCILLVDVTEHCNLNCPTCFASAGTNVGRYARVPHIMRTLDASIEREGGRIDVLMLSGGEPTVHPEIVEIIREATDRNVTRVLLNTNGVRVAKDDAFLAALTDLRDRCEIYLQFDGFDLATHLHHRGEDLREIKQRAINRLTDAGIFTTLVMVVADGVNDHEIGRVAEFAFDTDYVAGVAYQPVFGSGRSNPIDPMQRMTTTGVLKRIGPQSNGRVAADDFIALPCSHPDCCAITYFIREDDGRHRSIPSLVGLERLKANLGLVGNRIAADDGLWEALIGMMSETTTVSRPELIDYLVNICEACDLGMSGFLRSVGDYVRGGRGEAQRRLAAEVALRTKRLSVKSFMDAWTLNIERLQQCCVHVGSVDGESDPVRIPFCARQLFGSLRARTSAGQVGARQLVQLDGVMRS